MVPLALGVYLCFELLPWNEGRRSFILLISFFLLLLRCLLIDFLGVFRSLVCDSASFGVTFFDEDFCFLEVLRGVETVLFYMLGGDWALLVF